MMWCRELLNILEFQIETPKPYGSFHLVWLLGAVFVIIFLSFVRKRNNDKQLKCILGIYGITAFILELLKQIIWSVEYDPSSNTFLWDYTWYAFPFQLCTTPIYVCIICLFLKKGRLRDSLLTYIAYITILGSISSALIPDSLFVSDLLVDIHTMWLHLGSLVVSVYLLMSKEVVVSKKSLKNAILVFIFFVVIANILNIAVYNSGILNGETFNMFYISPYFESTLPIFDIIYKNTPYPVFLLVYIAALSIGSYIIYKIAQIFSVNKVKNN